MQRFKTTIKISWLWLPAIFLLPYLHMGKLTCFIFFILSVHELSHVLVAKLFRFKIEKIILYPFGLSAYIPQLGYGSVFQEICIISAGPLSQVMFPTVFLLMERWGIISQPFYEYLLMINANIMIFNLLPIYPLDGGRLLQTFFHCFARYKVAQRFTCIVSVVMLFIVMGVQLMRGYSALLVQLFLGIQIIIAYRDIHYDCMKFYHYRYLHPVRYSPILNTKKDLYRARYNVMKMKGGWCEEASWLASFFRRQKR
ncbi:site-2 protease family protein [Amedibacillus sp. YH-ame10]